MSKLDEKEYSEKVDMGIWKQIISYLKPHKTLATALVIIMIIVSLLDLSFTFLSKYAITNIIEKNDLSTYSTFSIVSIATAMCQGVSIFFFIYLAGKVEAKITADMRRAAFVRAHELTFSYHDKTPVGYLMARLTSDVSHLGMTISWGIVDIFWAIATVIFVIISMFILNVTLALIVLAVMFPLGIVMMLFQRKILNLERTVRKTNSKITRYQNESIVGARTTKTLVREDLNFEEFSGLTTTLRKASIKSRSLGSMFWPLISILGSISTGLVLWRGGVLTAKNVIDYGTLIAFISFSGRLFEPLNNFARIFAELQSSQASAERVVDLINTPVSITEKENIEEEYGTMFAPKKENWPVIKGSVRFENINFHYNEEEPVISNFNLEVKSGQMIALVGETGSGKSTIVNLLCRFYEPIDGTVYIDGVDYRNRSQHWMQSNIGYVLQSPHLFSGTIKDNIKYGKLDATDEEVENAAKLVNLDQFVKNFEKGYDTPVGEGGSLISTGEKQLISFARAILTNPRIFVLDEATSSIDTETEKIIQNAISKVLEGRTSFVVAHRLSTIKEADVILVLKNGVVDESGTHEELMKKEGYYYKLYTNQFKQEQSKKALE